MVTRCTGREGPKYVWSVSFITRSSPSWQIVSPVDSLIAQSIEDNLEPWKGIGSDLSSYERAKEGESLPLLRNPLPGVADAYYQQVKEVCCTRYESNSKATQKVVYTAMHGVGKDWIRRVMATFGHPPCVEVAQQIEPDPEFPTVAFPNPEEGRGALKLAMETAESVGSRLIIANDPDADRFAAAELQSNEEWRIFTGNELGTLFAHWIWTTFRESHPEVDPATCCLINTTVSSKMLRAIAEKEGLEYEETLTGFKWLGSLAMRKLSEGKTPILCYEEAIGYLIRDICFDKDGVSAAGTFVEMYQALAAEGKSLSQHLESLYQTYGYFAANNRYFFCYDPATLARIFKRIRSLGGERRFPSHVGRFALKGVRDLTVGYDDMQPNNKPILHVSASSEMITFYFENGAVVTLRGSGTEPKLKYYAEMKGSDLLSAQKELDELLSLVIEEFLQPSLNDLKPPSD